MVSHLRHHRGRHARRGPHDTDSGTTGLRRLLAWSTGLVGAAAAATAYMAFEAQWVKCREAQLHVAGLPPAWSGLTILHLSDVHAGVFLSNELSLRRVARWAAPLAPDLVFLTGDVLGDPERSAGCLRLLAQLRPKLGTFAVTGNHEYGLGKGPLAHSRDTSAMWEQAGITLLRDRCVALPAREGAGLVICGADHISGGFGLLSDAAGDDAGRPGTSREGEPGDAAGERGEGGFHILLIHEPPGAESPLARLFSLAFAGHTHGGQLRVPGRAGLVPVSPEEGTYLSGVHSWGRGRIVISRGVGTSFVPLRLLTRPEATLWRLV